METMATALRRYFDESGFGEDGEYASDWADFKLGPLPFPLPNTEARKRAVRFHELHHVFSWTEMRPLEVLRPRIS